MRPSPPMRSRVALALVILASLGGCPAPAPPPRAPEIRELAKAPSREEESVPAYVIADVDTLYRGGRAILLDSNSLGVVVDGQRMIGPVAGTFSVSSAAAEKRRIAREITAPPIAAVDRIPPWLGGGFLFRSGTSLYASDAFDGALRPLVSIPAGISRLSFGPKGALIRAADGQRWVIDLATGARAPIAPAGLLDIAAIADGRAAALTEGNRVFTSQDRGEHWTDVTAQLGGAPAQVLTQPGQPSAAQARNAAPQPEDPASLELWITDDLSHAYRLEPSGALLEFDQLPPPPTPIRPRDPAWHGTESPLVAAVRRGVRLDDGTALVAENGDIARIDLRTGQVRVTGAGRVPPDLPCEGVRVGDDVVFICAVQHRPSAIISRVLGEEGAWIERTFPDGGPFYVGDDGVIVFGGSCDGQRMGTSACVRDLHGEWHGFDAEADADAGVEAGADGAANCLNGPPCPGAEASFDPADIVRWIPRPGGRPVAVLGGPSPGTFDPVTGIVTLWSPPDSKRRVDDEVLRSLKAGWPRDRSQITDRSWTITEAGELRGWLSNGEGVRISPSGEVSRSAYQFPHAALSGPFGFAFDKDHRAWQTTDRGERWVEVEAPPRQAASGPHFCSSVGCDLGAWARLGWAASAPVHEPAAPAAPQPPSLPRPPLREIACAPAGDERMASLPPNDSGGDGFGLGARLLPVNGVDAKEQTIAYRRRFFSRGLVNPAYGRTADDERACRLLVHGFGAEFNSPDDPRSPFDGITVLGPRRDAQSFRRNLTFLEAFDPTAAVRTAGFGVRDLLDATRAAGTPLGRLFSPEGPEIDAVIPILPLDPAGPGGYVFTFPAESWQVVGQVLGGASPRLKLAGLRVLSDYAPPVSAAEVAPGEIAVLTVSSDGADEVSRLSAAGITGVAQLAAPPSTDLAPANPDALAAGPQGTVAILRTPSGADPPSALDPALLFAVAGGPPQALAPWSTLTVADDPACRADSGGYRAIVTTVSPWLRVKGAPPLSSSAVGVMAARVRWSPTRVCLEAVELPSVSRPTRGGDTVETTLVARFLAPGGAARIGLGPGSELRQAMTCSLSPP